MTLIFLIITGLILFIQYKRENNMVNLVSIITAPYFVIVLLNNTLFYKNGFYKISNSVLAMLLSSLVAFFIGATFATPNHLPDINEEDNEIRFEKYRLEAMRNFLVIIAFIGMLRVLLLIRGGSFNAENFNDSEGIITGGVVGHLLLISYSILPIVFLYWLENKKRISYLIPVIMIVGITFASFIKYNAIGVIITLFIFTCLYKKSLLNKAVIVLLTAVLAIFVSNYALGFYIRSVNVSSRFYSNHLWNYMAGSVIYDNYLFPNGINTQLSIGYKMMTFLMAFPNMFLRKIVGGAGLFPHVKKNFLPVGVVYGQTSNVTDAFGYLFPVNRSFIEYIVYYLLITSLGFIFSKLYLKAKKRGKYFNTLICNFMTYFVFLSFFGTFYINPGPWEILLYSSIFPSLFLKATNLRKGIIRIV